jgi:thiol-disulfide isomerase/thioredoxin
MITRRLLILSAGAMALPLPAFAKKGDTPLPPPLADLSALALTRADGSPTTLGAEVRQGRAVIVSLWATWCAPCLSEAKHLSDLRKKHGEDRLVIIGINVDKTRDEKKIATFLKKGGVNYTQLRGDSEATYTAFGGSLPVTLPRLYVFTPNGTPTAVFGVYSGGQTLKQVDKAAEAAMNGQAP